MTDEELYGHFSNLVQTVPDFTRPAHNEVDLWLAKLDSLLKLMNDTVGLLELRRHVAAHNQSILITGSTNIARYINAILLRNHSFLELKLSPALRGGFIPVGSSFDGFKLVNQIFGRAQASLFVIDPYMDEKILTDFLISTSDNIEVKLLSDQLTHRPTLKVATEKWRLQYGASKPLATKLAAERTLHDRLIIVDDTEVWTVTQSFKDLAIRSPASIIKVDDETARLKSLAYLQMWALSSPI
jgi:hypothetical protein